MILINSLLPIILLVTLGWVVGRCKFIDSKANSLFANYVMNISFPALLLLRIASDSITAVSAKIQFAILLALLVPYFSMLGYQCFYRRADWAVGSARSLLIAFPNMTFIGIPLLTQLFGNSSLLLIVIGNLVISFLLLPLSLAGFESGTQQLKSPIKILQRFPSLLLKPLVLAPLIGYCLAKFHLPLPQPLAFSLSLLGQSTSGVALFTLGLVLAAYPIRLNRNVIQNVLIKIIAQPFLMFIITALLAISGKTRIELIFLVALPSAVTATMCALEYRIKVEEICSSALLSVLIAPFSLMLLCKLLKI